jgi:hypothetical protein
MSGVCREVSLLPPRRGRPKLPRSKPNNRLRSSVALKASRQSALYEFPFLPADWCKANGFRRLLRLPCRCPRVGGRSERQERHVEKRSRARLIVPTAGKARVRLTPLRDTPQVRNVRSSPARRPSHLWRQGASSSREIPSPHDPRPARAQAWRVCA